jgi:prepilin-type N-terminal cleavage/methylation domain-containing protein
MKQFSNIRGFTLVELVIAIAIIGVLSGIVLFAITQYINQGKDASIASNLAVLIPAGEVYYNGNNSSYSGFCDPNTNSVIKNAILQMPQNPASGCYNSDVNPSAWTSVSNPAGVCCYVNSNGNSWAALARKFSGSSGDNFIAYCVDSRGVKEETDNLFPKTQCP